MREGVGLGELPNLGGASGRKIGERERHRRRVGKLLVNGHNREGTVGRALRRKTGNVIRSGGIGRHAQVAKAGVRAVIIAKQFYGLVSGR